jgi:hypothetical protein
VTRENIDAVGRDGKPRHSDRIVVTDEAQARSIAVLLVRKVNQPGAFDNLEVRLKLESPAFDGPLFVDNKGTVDYKGQIYPLDPAAFGKLAAALRPMLPKR